MRLAMDKLDEIEFSRLPKQERRLERLEIEVEVAFLDSVEGGDDCNDADSQQLSHEAPTPVRANTTQKRRPFSADINSDMQTTSTSQHARETIQVTGKVKKDLSLLSDALDKLVASIDSVESRGSAEVRKRKKGLSSYAVKLMDRVDGLISQIQP